MRSASSAARLRIVTLPLVPSTSIVSPSLIASGGDADRGDRRDAVLATDDRGVAEHAAAVADRGGDLAERRRPVRRGGLAHQDLARARARCSSSELCSTRAMPVACPLAAATPVSVGLLGGVRVLHGPQRARVDAEDLDQHRVLDGLRDGCRAPWASAPRSVVPVVEVLAAVVRPGSSARPRTACRRRRRAAPARTGRACRPCGRRPTRPASSWQARRSGSMTLRSM